MKRWLPELLRCPTCASESSPLTLESPEVRHDEVLAGRLVCADGHAFPIVDAVPDFVGGEGRAAGDSAVYDTLWDAHARQRYAGRAAEYAEKFQAFARLPAPLEQYFAGQTVLDAGCGEGRFTWLAAALGAARVVAVDSSREALGRAITGTGDPGNVSFVRADILNLPLRRAFDYAFSLGVLHHTPDSERGFGSVVRCLKPGGHVTVFVYRPWSLPWAVWPLRRVTRRLDPARVLRLCEALGLGYDAARPAKIRLGRALRTLGPLDVLGVGRITYEGLTTPHLREHSLREVRRWFAAAGVELISSTRAVSASGRLPAPGGPARA